MRRMKRSTRQILVSLFMGLIVVGIGITVAYVINSQRMKKTYETEIENLQTEIASNKRYVYKAINTIAEGDILDQSDLEYSEEYYSLDAEKAISEEDIGKRTLIQITPGQVIYTNMIESDLEYGLREMEYALFRFNSNIVENDTVDIRLAFPNGEDYIVLNKKILKNVDLSCCRCNLWLNEEEILRLSSAIVDAANLDSAYLYTAKYIEPGQEETIVTYQPSEDVMLEIANNPNIVEAAAEKLNLRERKELENRLDTSIKEGKHLPEETSEAITEEQSSQENEETSVNQVDDTYQE